MWSGSEGASKGGKRQDGGLWEVYLSATPLPFFSLPLLPQSLSTFLPTPVVVYSKYALSSFA